MSNRCKECKYFVRSRVGYPCYLCNEIHEEMEGGWFTSKKNQQDGPIKVPTEAPAEPTIKDSGNRRVFETGAQRDCAEGRGRCDLMPLDVVSRLLYNDSVLKYIGDFQQTQNPEHLYLALAVNCNGNGYMYDSISNMFLELSKHFEAGAKKYGEYNWQKGIPVNCYIDSAVRHYLKWLRGDTDEPHDRAFCWNIVCCIWEVKHGGERDKPHES